MDDDEYEALLHNPNSRDIPFQIQREAVLRYVTEKLRDIADVLEEDLDLCNQDLPENSDKGWMKEYPLLEEDESEILIPEAYHINTEILENTTVYRTIHQYSKYQVFKAQIEVYYYSYYPSPSWSSLPLFENHLEETWQSFALIVCKTRTSPDATPENGDKDES